MQVTLTDDDEIGVKRAESQVFSRSAATYHLEFCTDIALRGNCLESLANCGGHTFVPRLHPGEHVFDRPLAPHIINSSILMIARRDDMNPRKTRPPLMGHRSCTLRPPFSPPC